MSVVEGGDHPFTQHDHLFRQLLESRLVEPTRGGTGGGWQLTAAAEQRVRELVAPPVAADKMVFFSHRCVRCGEHRPTRRQPDGFVCDPCRRQAQPPRPEEVIGTAR
jgi:hypothetical protein